MPSSYAVGDHFEQFIRQQVQTGRYASASELVREALRLLETRERLREFEAISQKDSDRHNPRAKGWMDKVKEFFGD